MVRRGPLEIASRVSAAVLGGYALTFALVRTTAATLPLPPVDALMVPTLLSFAVYVAAIVWAMGVSSPGRAWLGLLGPAVLLLALSP